MLIDFRNTTKVGNNVSTSMFFDGMVVARQFHCTPAEFDEFVRILNAGAEETGNEGVTVSQT